MMKYTKAPLKITRAANASKPILMFFINFSLLRIYYKFTVGSGLSDFGDNRGTGVVRRADSSKDSESFLESLIALS